MPLDQTQSFELIAEPIYSANIRYLGNDPDFAIQLLTNGLVSYEFNANYIDGPFAILESWIRSHRVPSWLVRN